MPTGELFKFYLMKDATTYYVSGGRGAGTTAIPTPLQHAPEGWQDTQIKFGRNETYWGVVRSYSEPYEFVKDGAAILRYVFYNEGVEGICKLVIKKLRTSDLLYVDYFEGDIDFSQFVDKKTSVTGVLMERGLVAYLKANDSITYEIPILSDAIRVNVDGIRQRNTSSMALSNDPAVSSTAHQLMPVIRNYFNESDIQVDTMDQPVMQALGTSAIITGFPFFKASISGDVVIKYSLDIQVGNLSGSNLATKEYRAVVVKYNSVTSTSTVYNLLVVSNYLNIVARQIASGTLTIPIAEGEKLVYFAGIFPFNLSAGTDAFMIEQTYGFSTLEIKYDLKATATVVKGYRFYDVFRKVANNIAEAKAVNGVMPQYGQSVVLSSPNVKLVDSSPFQNLVISGDGMRGLAVDSVGNAIPPVIKTSFRDCVTTAQNIYDVALGVYGEKYVLEPVANFFKKDSLIADLGEISADDVELHVASAYLGNVINIGYQSQDYDNLNGKDEPNNTSTFKLPILRVPKSFDWISEYRADMHGIEKLRIEYANKTTTDSFSDNSIFMLDIEAYAQSNGTYNLNRPQKLPGNSVAGTIALDTGYNYSLTPGRSIRRRGSTVRIATWRRENEIITFQTSDKNKTLVSNLGSGAIAEAGDIRVSSLTPPHFLPVLIKFQQSYAPLNEQIRANPYGYFGFTIKGNPFKAFIDDVGVNLATLDVYQFSLLLHPDTDINLLYTLLAE